MEKIISDVEKLQDKIDAELAKKNIAMEYYDREKRRLEDEIIKLKETSIFVDEFKDTLEGVKSK